MQYSFGKNLIGQREGYYFLKILSVEHLNKMPPFLTFMVIKGSTLYYVFES